MISQHVTLLPKLRDALPLLVFNSLEKKDDPCNSDSPTFTLFEKMRDTSQYFIHQRGRTTPVKVIAQHFTLFEKISDTLPFLVFNSFERKDDPCKSDSGTFYPF